MDKTFENILDRAREIYRDPAAALARDANLTNEGSIAAIRVALIDLFSEEQLGESEDERVIKGLENFLWCIANGGMNDRGTMPSAETCQKWLTYLEKLKIPPMSATEVLVRAGLKPYKDGNQWCILAGDNIQEGICGFGDTIDEALYQFLMEVLDLQKKQKPAEWSEDDETMLRTIISDGSRGIALDSKQISWLKSRPSWKPSEEQMEALRVYLYHPQYIDNSEDIRIKLVESLYNDLQKLL